MPSPIKETMAIWAGGDLYDWQENSNNVHGANQDITKFPKLRAHFDEPNQEVIKMELDRLKSQIWWTDNGDRESIDLRVWETPSTYGKHTTENQNG